MWYMGSYHSRRGVLGSVAALAGTAPLSGCLGGQQPALTGLEEWPPDHDNDALSFWTWQEYWGNQARAFKHVADLDRIAQENVPASEQFSRLRGGSAVDVLHVPSRTFGRILSNELVQPLPVEKMPNWPGTDGFRAHDEADFRREGEFYGVPQTPMMHAMVYHSELVDGADSWALLWDEDLEGRIAMPADPVTAAQIAALYTGQDPNNPADFAEIETALSRQRPLVDGYWTDWMDSWRRFGRDELAAGVLPSARMCLCSQDGTPVRRVAPREGVLYGQSTLAVAADATNPWAALEFINWSVDFKAASSLLWTPDEWTLYPARPLPSTVRKEYIAIGDRVGIGRD
jgi:spermidine/putrescine transport system substrate-binding protein